MLRVTSIQFVRDNILRLAFNDGAVGEIDIAQFIPFDGVFTRLNDPVFFQQVRINQQWGVIEWPGGLDLDTESLYAEVTGNPIEANEEKNVSMAL